MRAAVLEQWPEFESPDREPFNDAPAVLHPLIFTP
jgi:hypothetical protein